MKALKTTLFLFICNLFVNTSNSQSHYYYYNDRYYNMDWLYEVGISAGAMNCITDIGGANTDQPTYFNEIRQRNNRLSKGVYLAAIYQNILGFRLEGTMGQVTSADSTITGKTNNLVSKYVRNLSFKSKVSEISVLTEFHPLLLLDVEMAQYVSPYVLAGVGFFHFNPQAEFRGKTIDLHPLRTEGQGFEEYPDRKPYSLSQFNIPMGVGVKCELGGLFNLRLEFVHRRLFTDYLDDASTKKYVNPSLFAKYLSPADAATARILYNRSIDGSIPIFRGHFQNNDAYMTLSLKLGLILGWESTGTSRRGLKQLRCGYKNR